jgi:hypothetical protein
MRSPAQAIIWEICAKNRRALLVAFGLIPFCALGQALIPPGKEMAGFTQSMCVMITIVSIIWACSYTADDSRGRFSGFPSWMYTLPLCTSAMVILPLMLGALLMGAAVVLWEITVCRYWNIRIEPRNLCWHVLLTVSGLAWIQALIWSLHRFRWIRIVALVAAIYGFLYVGLVAHVWNFDGGASWWFGGVSIAAAGAVLAAVLGVERDRRGEWVGWTGRLLEFVLDLLPRRTRPFASSRDAQLWMEWRRRGFLLGTFLGVPLPLALTLLPLPEALYLDPIETMISFSLPLFVVLLIAASIGSAVAKSDAWSPMLSVHPFIGARPQSTAAIVFAKMKSAAGITILGWIVFCCLGVPAILWCNHANWPNEQARRFFPDFAVNFPRLWNWASNPITVLALIVVTWHGMIQAMSIALTGSKRRIVCAAWTGAIGWAFLIGSALWVIKEADREKVLLVIRMLPFLTAALFCWKLFQAAVAFVAATRLVTRRDFCALAGLWIVVAALVLTAAALAHVERGPGASLLWFVVALQFFPSGEIPGCVVNLTRNRHR